MQPEVVKEQTEVALTDNHVTQFLNLKVEPDNTESTSQVLTTSGHELEMQDQSDQRSKYPLERQGLKHDPTNNDSQDAGPKSNGSMQSKLKECGDVKHDTATSKPAESENDIEKSKCDVSAKGDCSIEDINLDMKEQSSDMKDGAVLEAENDMGTEDHSHRVVDNLSVLENDVNVAQIGGKNVQFYTSGHLLTGEELLAYCQWLHHRYGDQVKTERDKPQTVIGLVSCKLLANAPCRINPLYRRQIALFTSLWFLQLLQKGIKNQ